ncbi:hypothetical protein B7463_g3338, partial [Scytalidium lignicola]
MSSIFGTYLRNTLTDQLSRSTFTYSPLDSSKNQIRLLRFVRSQHGSSFPQKAFLSLELYHCSFDSTPKYHALSYVWGSSVKNRPILLNGKTWYITRSLELALQRFEDDDDVEWLWADALCINQTDDVEKSSQVMKMREIFQNARVVLAWFGPPSEGSESLFRNLGREGSKLIDMGWSRLHERGAASREDPHPDSLPSSECWPAFQSFSIIISQGRSVLSRLAAELSLRDSEGGVFPHAPMHDFLARPLWNRVWIVQEFAVAKDLYLVCGQAKLKYSHFLVVYFLYYRFYEDQRLDEPLGPHSQQFASKVSAIFPIFWQTIVTMRQQSRGPLKEILTSVFRLGATDPRDRVYAITGLAKDSKLMGIRTDYSMTYTDMSIEVAWRLFRLHGLWILTHSHGLRASEHGSSLPSWVPDWSLRSDPTLNKPRFDEDGDFSASGVSAMCTQPSFEEVDFQARTIAIMGTIVATVSETGSAVDFSVPRVTPRNFQTARILLDALEHLSGKFSSFTTSEVAAALWQIPIAHRNAAHIPPVHQSTYQDKSEQWRQGYATLIGNTPAPPNMSSEDETQWRVQKSHFYLEHLCRKSDAKRPFACHGEKEYLGMGPQEMEPGDQIKSPKFKHHFFRLSFEAVLVPNLSNSIRWRMIAAQPIILLGYSITMFPWLFRRSFKVEYLPIAPDITATIAQALQVCPTPLRNKLIHVRQTCLTAIADRNTLTIVNQGLVNKQQQARMKKMKKSYGLAGVLTIGGGGGGGDGGYGG